MKYKKDFFLRWFLGKLYLKKYIIQAVRRYFFDISKVSIDLVKKRYKLICDFGCFCFYAFVKRN